MGTNTGVIHGMGIRFGPESVLLDLALEDDGRLTATVNGVLVSQRQVAMLTKHPELVTFVVSNVVHVLAREGADVRQRDRVAAAAGMTVEARVEWAINAMVRSVEGGAA